MDDGWSHDGAGAARQPVANWRRVRLHAMFACRRRIEVWVELDRRGTVVKHFATVEEAWDFIEKLKRVADADASSDA